MLVERAFASTVDFADLVGLRSTLITEIPRTTPASAPDTIWDEEQRIVNGALASDDPAVFLKVLPGKPLVGPAAATLGLTKERYCELLKSGLGGSADPSFQSLHTALDAALSSHLPQRRVSSTFA